MGNIEINGTSYKWAYWGCLADGDNVIMPIYTKDDDLVGFRLIRELWRDKQEIEDVPAKGSLKDEYLKIQYYDRNVMWNIRANQHNQ